MRNFTRCVFPDYEDVLFATITPGFLTYDNFLGVVSKTTGQNTGVDDVVLLFTDPTPLELVNVLGHGFYHTGYKRLKFRYLGM